MTPTWPATARHVVVSAAAASVVWALFLRTVGPADLEVFVRAGQSVSRGLSPYVDPSSSDLWSGHAFVYPYLVAWVFAPLGALSDAAASSVFYVASVAAVLLAVRIQAGRRAGVVMVLVLTAEPVVRGLQLGTLNVWLLLGLVLAWRYRERAAVVVVALTAVIVAKLFLLPMLAWLLLASRWRTAALTAATSVAAVLLGCLFAGQAPAAFSTMLSRLSRHEAAHSSSLTALAMRAGAGPTGALVFAVAAAALVVAVGAVRARCTGEEAPLFCACVLASLAASPIVWSHYYTLLAVFPLVLHWRVRSVAVAWGVTWLVWTPVGQPWLHVLHPFPAAGWVWGATVAGIAVVARRAAVRRRGDVARVTGLS